MGGQSDPLWIVQQIKVCPYEHMIYAQPNICPGEWHTHTQTPMGFWHKYESLNLGQTTRPYNNQQEKRTCKIVDFAVPTDHRIKLKESEKKEKYLDLARESKKLWNMKVIIIPIVIGAFGTFTKRLVQEFEDLEIRGRVETILTTRLFRTARILSRVLETWG